MSLAFVFPGQGSQSLGMLAELAREHDVVKDVFAIASEVLGYDLWELTQNGPESRLNDTTVTQPAMLAAGVATWRIWEDVGGATPSQMAGHSLGEYSALVCAGAMSLTTAMTLVKERAQRMADAVPDGAGAMAAILGLDDEAVGNVCTAASDQGVCEAVNFNSPNQVVIAGQRAAIEKAVEVAKEQGARRALLLSVSVPAHSSLMTDAGKALSESLANADIRVPTIPVVSSVNAALYQDIDVIRQQLSEQVYRPVRWVATVHRMTDDGASSFIECGPGKVLTGLLKRIDRSIPGSCIDTLESLQKAMQ